ncbi:unnamed protein product [Calypogeia fissa]
MSPSMDRRVLSSCVFPSNNKVYNLHSSIWSLLPDEVLISVLAWLPLHCLAQLRTVCKKWNALWSNPDFLKLRSRVLTEEETWYCFNSYDNELWGHDNEPPEQQTKHSLCYLPKTNKKLSLEMSLKNLWPLAVERVVATAGGLMLCVADLRYKLADNLLTDLIVCNPLKKDCWKKLPERRSLCHVLGARGFFKDQAVGMLVDTKTNSYKVIISSIYWPFNYIYQVVGRRPVRGSTEVYDSRTNRWKVLQGCLYCDEVGDKWNDKCETANYRGYLIAYSREGLYLFWDEKEDWVSFPLPENGTAVRIVRLEECEGRLLLVGTSEFPCNCVEESYVHVWEFDCPNGVSVREGSWKELSRVGYADLIARWPIRVGSEEGARFLAGVRPNSTDLMSCIFNNSYSAKSEISLYDFDLPFYTSTHPYNLRSAGERPVLPKGDYASLLLYCPSQNNWCLAAQDYIKGGSGKSGSYYCERVRSAEEKLRCERYSYLGPGYRFQPRIAATV